VPERAALAERLDAVLSVVYLVFSEGYAGTAGDALVRRELCGEAIRLGRLLFELMPDESEVSGLLALMLLHDSRRETRTSPEGELLLLEEQDRSRWDRVQITEGVALVERALRMGRVGAYSLQAAIAALHAEASSAASTDWRQITALYGVLLRIAPSPVIQLNRAVALSMAEGPAPALELVEAIEAGGELRGYHLLPAVRADLLRRLDRRAEAAVAYRAALRLVALEPERRFLERRLQLVEDG
jgi:RNA polymerase sigma-70 factor, ECF subfamily